MSEKSQWGSKLGFILASAGSAIGLGAVWKFPYMTAANGGGGFLLVFLISTLLIGFPLLLAEFALGRSAGVSAIKTFGKLGTNPTNKVVLLIVSKLAKGFDSRDTCTSTKSKLSQ